MSRPAVDVLPSGLRRHWSLRDAVLPVVLVVELLAGVGLGVVAPWDPGPAAAAEPPVVSKPAPVVVQPALPAPVVVVTHAPRDPFTP